MLSSRSADHGMDVIDEHHDDPVLLLEPLRLSPWQRFHNNEDNREQVLLEADRLDAAEAVLTHVDVEFGLTAQFGDLSGSSLRESSISASSVRPTIGSSGCALSTNSAPHSSSPAANWVPSPYTGVIIRLDLDISYTFGVGAQFDHSISPKIWQQQQRLAKALHGKNLESILRNMRVRHGYQLKDDVISVLKSAELLSKTRFCSKGNDARTEHDNIHLAPPLKATFLASHNNSLPDEPIDRLSKWLDHSNPYLSGANSRVPRGDLVFQSDRKDKTGQFNKVLDLQLAQFANSLEHEGSESSEDGSHARVPYAVSMGALRLHKDKDATYQVKRRKRSFHGPASSDNGTDQSCQSEESSDSRSSQVSIGSHESWSSEQSSKKGRRRQPNRSDRQAFLTSVQEAEEKTGRSWLPAALPSNNDKHDATKNFHCSWCWESFGEARSWKRHEEIHAPQVWWVCMLNGLCDDHGRCVLCQEMIVDRHRNCVHSPWKCLGRRDKWPGRCFSRKDELMKHVRKLHKFEDRALPIGLNDWSRPETQRLWDCFICSEKGMSWEERYSHVIKHKHEDWYGARLCVCTKGYDPRLSAIMRVAGQSKVFDAVCQDSKSLLMHDVAHKCLYDARSALCAPLAISSKTRCLSRGLALALECLTRPFWCGFCVEVIKEDSNNFCENIDNTAVSYDCVRLYHINRYHCNAPNHWHPMPEEAAAKLYYEAYCCAERYWATVGAPSSLIPRNAKIWAYCLLEYHAELEHRQTWSPSEVERRLLANKYTFCLWN